jgi:hypothetical protein
MPTLTRWFIKSSMLYLIGAMLLLLLITLNGIWDLPLFVAFLNPVFFHMLVVGWVTQMIFGVIYWMFPIITRQNPRGSLCLGWATYICLNVGLLLRVVGEPLLGTRPEAYFGWLLVLSALLQWLAAVFFVINSWPRIKERYRGE